MTAIGRNQPCPCGSGKKYKHCCAQKQKKMSLGMRVTAVVIALILAGGVIAVLTSLDDVGYETGGPRRVWSEEHQHWH